jgi:micrococcal nuclease
MVSRKVYEFEALVIRVVDADTLDLLIDLGFEILTKQRIRLARVDAWENRGAEREKGLAATEFVKCLLAEGRTKVLVQTSKERGKFGRYLAEVHLKDGPNLGDLLLEEGHARLYEG